MTTINVRELAVEVDTILAGLYGAKFFHVESLASLEDRVRHDAGQTREEYRERRFGPVTYGPWSGTLREALDAIDPANHYGEQYRHHAAQLAQINIEQAEAGAVYRDHHWTRAVLVINSNGHVHSSMDCSTCFDSTRYEWLVHYSGADEAEIVADAGETACTVCYPTAPAEVLNRPANLVSATRAEKDAAKAQRESEKAARAAAKLAKAATIDGTDLVIPDDWDANRTDRIDTEHAARREWNSDQDSLSSEIDTSYASDPVGYLARMEARRERQRVRQSLIEQALDAKHGREPGVTRQLLLAAFDKRRK